MKQRSITKNSEELSPTKSPLKLSPKNDNNSDFITLTKNRSITTTNAESTPQKSAVRRQLNPIIINSTKNYRYVNSPKLITIINNNNSNNLIKSINPSNIQPSKFKLPKISILVDADNILKNRERSHGISTNPLISRSALKKSEDVRLKNYMIKEIIKKREEKKEIEKSMTEEIQKKEKKFDKKY